MKSKIISVLMASAALFTFASMGAKAEGQPEINVSSARAAVGEMVDVTVSLANNPGIISMLLDVDYDEQALQLVDVRDVGALGSQLHSNDLKKVPYTLFWSNGTAPMNFTTNGAVAILTFQVSTDAEKTEYPITVSYDKENDGIFNYDFISVDFSVNSGIITVCNDIEAEKDAPSQSLTEQSSVSDGTISVTIDGKYVNFPDQQPVLQNDRTLVPLRAIFEALGATVDWNEDTQTVTAAKGNDSISLTIGSDILYVNHEEIRIDVPAQIIHDRTMVPVRAIAESFHCSVDWNEATKTVIIMM